MADNLEIDVNEYKEKCLRHFSMNKKIDYDTYIQYALDEMDEANESWTYVASRLYLKKLYEGAAQNRNYEPKETYQHFYDLLVLLTEKGIYHEALLNKYSRAEIDFFGENLNGQNDNLFTYLGLHTLATRYLATDHNKNIYELPQERWMVIAMYLMQDETERRVELVLEAYWALSHLYMTVATPTLNNAGKTHGQLSSCFIDTVDDSLQSIYDVNSDVAQLSKHGGGIGVYMGKVRAMGSSIKGFKGMSSGVVPWNVNSIIPQ